MSKINIAARVKCVKTCTTDLSSNSHSAENGAIFKSRLKSIILLKANLETQTYHRANPFPRAGVKKLTVIYRNKDAVLAAAFPPGGFVGIFDQTLCVQWEAKTQFLHPDRFGVQTAVKSPSAPAEIRWAAPGNQRLINHHDFSFGSWKRSFNTKMRLNRRSMFPSTTTIASQKQLRNSACGVGTDSGKSAQLAIGVITQ